MPGHEPEAASRTVAHDEIERRVDAVLLEPTGSWARLTAFIRKWLR